jgi:hypothetical protein
MERDERMIVYSDVDRVGEEVIREHIHGRTIDVFWDMFLLVTLKVHCIMKAYWGNGGTVPHS